MRKVSKYYGVYTITSFGHFILQILRDESLRPPADSLDAEEDPSRSYSSSSSSSWRFFAGIASNPNPNRNRNPNRNPNPNSNLNFIFLGSSGTLIVQFHFLMFHF